MAKKIMTDWCYINFYILCIVFYFRSKCRQVIVIARKIPVVAQPLPVFYRVVDVDDVIVGCTCPRKKKALLWPEFILVLLSKVLVLLRYWPLSNELLMLMLLLVAHGREKKRYCDPSLSWYCCQKCWLFYSTQLFMWMFKENKTWILANAVHCKIVVKATKWWGRKCSFVLGVCRLRGLVDECLFFFFLQKFLQIHGFIFGYLPLFMRGTIYRYYVALVKMFQSMCVCIQTCLRSINPDSLFCGCLKKKKDMYFGKYSSSL